MAENEGNTISADLKKFLAELIKISYKHENKDGVVDIINDYAWINDKTVKNSNGSISNKVPFCYIIERKSAVNAGVANILNMLNAASQNLGKMTDASKSMIDLFKGEKEPANKDSNFSDMLKSGLDTVNDTANGFINAMLKKLLSSDAQKLVAANNLSQSTALAPYKYLYITQETGKKYRFPLASQSSSFTPLKNSWGNTDKLPGFLQKAMDGALDTMEAVSKFTNFATNIIDFQGGGGNDIGNVREMAKSYTYAANGDIVTVNFTLYNTTKIDAWKDNYRFLFLFYLRNLPMRTDFASFIPPLLYDVLVPGVKQLPVCAVENLQIKPLGLTRLLTCENFLASAGKQQGNPMAVNVPEAWEVTITFRSLIANSMNLMIEGVYGGYKISTETSEDLTIETSVEESKQ